LTEVATQETDLKKKREALEHKEGEVHELRSKIQSQLEQVANLSARDAKEQHGQELAQTLQKLERERKEEVEKRGVEIITTALQRYARSHVSEITTTLFP